METVTGMEGRTQGCCCCLEDSILRYVASSKSPSLEEVVESVDDPRALTTVRDMLYRGALSLTVVDYAWGVDFRVRLAR
jgi:hypothetical protein